MQSTKNFLPSGYKMRTQNTNSIYYHYGEICSKVASSAHLSVVPSTRNIDNISEYSHPGIVMEPEELSDSVEEIEEHVEFECEEMTDSEGEEGSGCEQIAEMQDKDVHGILSENVTDGYRDDQQHELRNPTHALDSCFALDSPPFFKLGLRNLGKDATSNSWLSLNSCAPGRNTRPKNIEGTIIESAATKNIDLHPSRSFSRTRPSPKKIAIQKHAIDVAQQFSLSPRARKQRKRAGRTNTSLNIGTTMGSSRVDKNGLQ